jgi:putative sigma-54 modulation protein
MHLNIAFKHLSPNESIKTYTEERSKNLEKYFKGRITVTWNFSVEHIDAIAHCHLVGNNMDYFGEAMHHDLKTAIDLAFDKIERQVKKHKEIVKDHLHKHGHRVPTGEAS